MKYTNQVNKRIGIYSGTFDPVHYGHITFALEARQCCGLDEVVFLPERSPRGKQTASDVSHRLALLRGVVATEPGLRVLSLKTEQFTIAQTLPELQTLFPAAQLTLLVGSDVVCGSLAFWPDLDVLLKGVHVAIGLRDANTAAEVASTISAIGKKYNVRVNYTIVNTKHAALASTRVRSAQHDPAELHPATLAYIQQHRLYG